MELDNRWLPSGLRARPVKCEHMFGTVECEARRGGFVQLVKITSRVKDKVDPNSCTWQRKETNPTTTGETVTLHAFFYAHSYRTGTISLWQYAKLVEQ